jgi:diguanylate cyclase (GGDEF)-like protein
MKRLLYKLEDMYIRDEQTGLCNRRAIKDMGQSYLERSRANKSRLMVFSADMDNLKYINDNFGHAAGDIAIKTVADALSEAARDDEICIRMGGDEFAVIGIEYTEARMEEFINTFNNAIARFNSECRGGFYVEVSYGHYMLVPDEKTDLEECISIADARMYQQKYKKESIRLMKLGQKADFEKK